MICLSFCHFPTRALTLPHGLQVKYLLGYNVPRANQLHKMLYSLIAGSNQLRWPELAMGLCWIALLLGIRYIAVRQRYVLLT